jgi:hypothetical protein
MDENIISEEQQIILDYSIDRLYQRYDTAQDLVKDWLLFGPCIERCPKPEVRRPWMSGLKIPSGS